MPMIDAVGDTGKFVGAILAEPEKYEGKTFCAAVKLYSLEDVAGIMSEATGKRVVYRQIRLRSGRRACRLRRRFLRRRFATRRILDIMVKILMGRLSGRWRMREAGCRAWRLTWSSIL